MEISHLISRLELLAKFLAKGKVPETIQEKPEKKKTSWKWDFYSW